MYVLKTFLKETALYAIGVFAIRLINFMLMPFLTRILTPADYGVITLILTIGPIVLYVITLHISQAIPKYCSNNSDIALKQSYTSTGLWFVIAVYIVFYVVSGFIPHLSQWLFGSAEYASIMNLALINIGLFGIFTYLETQLRWDQKVWQYTITSTVMMLVSLIFIGIFIFLKMGLKGYFMGSALGQLIGCILGYFYGRTNYRMLFSSSLLKEMLNFTFPLTIAAVSGYAFANMNQWMLRTFCDLNSVGIYGVASRFSSIVSVLFGCVSLSLTPKIYADYQKEGMSHFISFLFRGSLLISLWGATIFILFSHQILSLAVGKNFLEAAYYIPLVLLSYAFSSFYIFTPGQWIAGKTKEMAIVNIIAGLINFILALVLIKYFLIWGAVIGLFIGSAAQLMLNMIFSHRYYPIGFKLGRVLLSLGLFLLFYALKVHTVWWVIFCGLTFIILLQRKDIWVIKGNYVSYHSKNQT